MNAPSKTTLGLAIAGLFLSLLLAQIDGDNAQEAIDAAKQAEEYIKREASEKGKRKCKTLCMAIGGWHKAHGPNQCICRDRDGCTTVFTAKAYDTGFVQRPYHYINPITIGKCAGIRK